MAVAPFARMQPDTHGKTGGRDGATMVEPGDVLAGKYRVERVLGRGGMGIVVAAHHVQLDTKVAIKFLLPEVAGHSEASSRFAREARAAAKISSEHVVRVLDVGTLESGAPYIVMEYLEGEDLGARLAAQGPMPVEQAVEVLLQAAVAVAEAHAAGIVHRDLKPANLFCARRPDGQLQIKVLDFGISKLSALSASEGGLAVTATSVMMGSPIYMSPEQMQSAKSADAQSDVWALGVILHELLAGLSPFAGDTLPEVTVKVMTAPAPPIRTLRPDVPEGVERAILGCLEKDRALRTKNVAELAAALAPFAPDRARASIDRIFGTLRGAGLSSASPVHAHGLLAPAPGAMSTPPVSQTNVGPAPARRGHRAAFALGLGGLIVLGVGGGLVARRNVAPTAVAVSGALASSTTAPVSFGSAATSTLVDVPPSGAPSMVAISPLSETPPVASAKPRAATRSVRGANVDHAPQPVVSAVRSSSEAPRPSTTSAPSSPAPSSPAPGTSKGADCDPPYRFDSDGRKHFKRECFLNTQ